MKKLLVLIFSIALVFSLTACSSVEQIKEEHPEGGILVTVGYGKTEYYIDVESIEYYSTNTTIKFNGKEFNTNDIVNSYPYYDKEELIELLNRFDIEVEGINK